MHCLFVALAILGIAGIGFMVMLGQIEPSEALGRIAWLIVALVATDIALSVLARLVIVPIVAALRVSLPVVLTLFCLMAALFLLALAVGALAKRFVDRPASRAE